MPSKHKNVQTVSKIEGLRQAGSTQKALLLHVPSFPLFSVTTSLS